LVSYPETLSNQEDLTKDGEKNARSGLPLLHIHDHSFNPSVSSHLMES
jgi:hypothetical protein